MIFCTSSPSAGELRAVQLIPSGEVIIASVLAAKLVPTTNSPAPYATVKPESESAPVCAAQAIPLPEVMTIPPPEPSCATTNLPMLWSLRGDYHYPSDRECRHAIEDNLTIGRHHLDGHYI